MADDIYTIQLKLETETAKRALADLHQKVDAVNSASNQSKAPAFQGLTNSTKQASVSLSSLRASLGPLIAGLAAAGISAKVFGDAMQRAAGLGDMADSISATTSKLQDYQLQMGRVGISASNGEAMLSKLAKSFEDLKSGSTDATLAFARLGISASDIDLRNFDGNLALVRSRLQAIGVSSLDATKAIDGMLGSKLSIKGAEFLKSSDIEDIGKITESAAKSMDKLEDMLNDWKRGAGNKFINWLADEKSAVGEFIALIEKANSFYNPAETGANASRLSTRARPNTYERFNPDDPYAMKKGEYDIIRQTDPTQWTRMELDYRKSQGIIEKALGYQSEEEKSYWKRRAAGEEKEIFNSKTPEVDKVAIDTARRTAESKALLEIERQITAEYAKANEARMTSADKYVSAVTQLTAAQKELKDLQSQLTKVQGDESLKQETSEFDLRVKIKEKELEIAKKTLNVEKARNAELADMSSTERAVAAANDLVTSKRELVALQTQLNDLQNGSDTSKLTSEAELLVKIKSKELEVSQKINILDGARLKMKEDTAKEVEANRRKLEDINREAAQKERQLQMDKASFASIFEGVPGLEDYVLSAERDLRLEKFIELNERLGLEYGLQSIAIRRIKQDYQELSQLTPIQLVRMSMDPQESDTLRDRARDQLGKNLERGTARPTDSLIAGAQDATKAFGTMSEQMFEIGQNLVNDLSNGFDGFFKSIISGSESAGEAFSNLANSIISQLLSMMTQALIVKPLMDSLMSNFGELPPPVGHTGLVVGGGYMNTFHTGGSADNIPVIAKRGETIVPQQDAHKRSTATQGITIINVSQDKFAEECAKNPDAIVNAISARRKQIKTILSTN